MSHLYEHLNQPDGRWLRDIFLLSILFGFLFLAGLGSAPLIDPDEGRYAEIPREMLERGDFVTPTLNYVKYFEKPPFLYWLNAGSMQLFGQHEWAARLPSTLSGLLTVLLTYAAGRKLFDRKTALIAALILGSSAGFLIQSRIILTDMLLTFCLSAALFCFLSATRCTDRKQQLFFQLFFIFSGLAVLAKGLIGIVLPGGIIFWYLLVSMRWQLLRQLPWFSGLLLFSTVTAPWFILVSLKNPEFPHFFFIHEHFQRYTSTIHQRSQPFWFFFPILILTMFPWSFFLPGSLKNAWHERHSSKGVTLFLLLWPLIIILFFSLSSSKLIPYILPVFPPLTLLIAAFFVSQWRSRKGTGIRAPFLLISLLVMILGICTTAVVIFPELWGHVQKNNLPVPKQLLLFSGIFFTAAGVLLLLGLRTRSTTVIVTLLLLFGIAIELMFPKFYSDQIAESLSSRKIAQAALQHATPQTILAQIGPNQGMNFYTRKRLMTVFILDELTFGSQQGDQRLWFPNFVDFVHLWKSDQHVLLVLPRSDIRNFATVINTTPTIVLETANQALLSNH